MIQSIAGQYRVGLSDVNSSLGQETCSQFRGEFGNDQVTFISCDVTSLTSVYILWKETTEFFKTNTIDLWVNNAGVMGEREGWNKCIDINLFGVLNGITTVMANTPAEADEVTIRKELGVPFEKSKKEMAVALKQCIIKTMLVKPKCV